MDLTERAGAWSYHRQGLGRTGGSLRKALAAVVAVYATHPTAPLALRARCPAFTPPRYRRLDADRTALRIPAMRGSVFLVPRETAATIFTAVRPVSSRSIRTLKRYGFAEREYAKMGRRIIAAASEPATSKSLESPAGVEGQRLGALLRCLRYEGRLLALPHEGLNSGAHRYVSTEAWIPDDFDTGDPETALAWLAGAYLRGYGPARVEDFAWWAGIGKRAAAKALATLPTVDVGDGLLLPRREEAAFGKVKAPRGTVDLLPKWDAYTMGHAPDGRRRFVHPDVQERVYTPLGVGLPGDGNPVVLVDGRAVATWTFSLKDGAAVQPFERLTVKVRRTVDERLTEIADLLTGVR